MPSKILDLQGLSSSSFFSDDPSFHSERQVGFLKSESMPNNHANGKSLASSPLQKHVAAESQSANSPEQFQSFLMRDPKTNHGLYRHAVGAGRAVSQSLTLLRPVQHDPSTISSLNVRPPPYFPEAGKINLMASQYENSLFSSSLSEVFSRKLRLSSNDAPYGHSVDTVASHFEEEEPFESTEEIEAQTIGNLLPSDDDLFTGVNDKLDSINQPSAGDDLEELDFFDSVGGMDLEDDGSAARGESEFPSGQLVMNNGSIAGEHPFGEHPSRTLFVRNIDSNVEDSELKALFEQYGDIRTLYTACKHRGFVMISYYDIRAARNAMKALQNQPLRRRKLNIHYSIPKDNPSEKDINHGTLVVFNLDSSVPNDELHQIFGVYGEIKEIREIPYRNHKSIEYYDGRAAEAALRALNMSDIAGKKIKLKPSCPGGSKPSLLQQISSDLEQNECVSYTQQSSPPKNSATRVSGMLPCGSIVSSSVDSGTTLGIASAIQAPFVESTFHHGISSSVPKSFPSLLRVDHAGNQSGHAEPSPLYGQLKFDIRGASNSYPHSLPEYHDVLNSGVHGNSPGTMSANINGKPLEIIGSRQLHRIGTNGNPTEFNDGIFGSAGNGGSLPGHHHAWGNSYTQSPAMRWPNSPSYANGISMVHAAPRLHGPPRAPPPMLSPGLPINNHHVGSAPTVNPSLWDRLHTYAGESPETAGIHPGSLGSMGISNNSLHSMEFVSHNIFPRVGGNNMDLPIPSKNLGLESHHQRSTLFAARGQIIPMINSFDPPNERVRSRRNEGSINQADKKQYELDIDRIMRGEDNRTTLMIKNIPNKYTSKMLLAAIDDRHKGTYDFIYLPIDFKNKCNVGYAFINMINPSHIITFYQSFNGKRWEKFNSEKVASLAYARIQGKAALVAHFQNSSLMNEDKRCRPILFNTDGPNAGDQVPFPMGVNVRTRPGKARGVAQEENKQGSPSQLANMEDTSNGDTTGKESD